MKISTRRHLEIKDFLNNNFIINGDYTISDDGVIDVNGDITVKNLVFNQDGFTELLKESNEIGLPIQFGYITGNFNFSGTKITTLKGFPHTVYGFCSISNSKKLKSLEFSPQCSEIWCHNCSNLKSLDSLNCNKFYGYNLKLEKFGTNFNAKAFNFNNFQTPTALKKHTEEFSMLDEIMYLNNKKPLFKYIFTMRRFIHLNPLFETMQENQWIQLIKDYHEHKDLFRAAQEFEVLYNEPLITSQTKGLFSNPFIDSFSTLENSSENLSL